MNAKIEITYQVVIEDHDGTTTINPRVYDHLQDAEAAGERVCHEIGLSDEEIDEIVSLGTYPEEWVWKLPDGEKVKVIAVSNPADPMAEYEDQFPMSDWGDEAQAGDTCLGYSEWLSHRIEAEHGPEVLAQIKADSQAAVQEMKAAIEAARPKKTYVCVFEHSRYTELEIEARSDEEAVERACEMARNPGVGDAVDLDADEDWRAVKVMWCDKGHYDGEVEIH